MAAAFFEKLKKLSLRQVFADWFGMVKRFSVLMGITVLGTGIALYLTESNTRPEPDWLIKLLLMTILSAPLSLALSLLAERFQWSTTVRWLSQVGIMAVLVLYYFLLPAKMSDFIGPYALQYGFFNAIAYLSLLVLPFLKKDESIGVWRYVERLIIRLFVTGIFSATLFAGLALSIWSVQYLFELHFADTIYFDIWIVVVGIFATWFFLSRYPKNAQDFLKEQEYPKVLRIFVQFILIPLLCIFFLILYTYVGKILITWNWPLGGVANWILAFSIAGVLAYMIGYPMIEKGEQKWLHKFFLYFFILILPLTIVLFMAIGMRIQQYGITEKRYLVTLFGIWLLGISLYYVLSHKKNIQIIPLSVAGVLLFSVSGPWGAVPMSMRSQISELENLLTKNSILVDGKIQKIEDEKNISQEERVSISSKVNYIINNGGVEKIRPWFTVDLNKHMINPDMIQNAEVSRYEMVQNALSNMGIKEVYYLDQSTSYFSFYNNRMGTSQATEVQGYSYLSPILVYEALPQPIIAQVDFANGKSLNVRLKDGHLFVESNKFSTELNIDLTSYVQKLVDVYGTTLRGNEGAQKEFIVDGENNSVKVRILINSINGQKRGDSYQTTNLEGFILFSEK